MRDNLNDYNSENYKICVCGQEGVGKTALLNRYITGSFISGYKPTIAASFVSSHEIIEDHTITLNIWDTAGQEKYQSMMPLYLRNVDCVLLVFDVTQSNSWDFIEKWFQFEFPNIRPIPLIFICANKIDLEPNFDLQLSEEWCLNRDIPFNYTSSMNGKNISQVFNEIAKKLDLNSNKMEIKKNNENLKVKSKNCCF